MLEVQLLLWSLRLWRAVDGSSSGLVRYLKNIVSHFALQPEFFFLTRKPNWKQPEIPDSDFRAVHRVIKWEQGPSALLSLGANDRSVIRRSMELNTANVSHFHDHICRIISLYVNNYNMWLALQMKLGRFKAPIWLLSKQTLGAWYPSAQLCLQGLVWIPLIFAWKWPWFRSFVCLLVEAQSYSSTG